MSLKLIIDKKTKKVVFAEASKEVVDFIFHILSLSLSTVVKLLQENNHEMRWCLDDLYNGIESFNCDYLHTGFNKKSVLNPSTARIGPFLQPHSGANMIRKYYYCSSNNCTYRSSIDTNYCLSHNHGHMITDSVRKTDTLSTMNPKYVKGPMSYMVMDNLETKLLSMSLIKPLINDMSSVEEKEVKFGRTEAIAMLKASLETKSVLTTIFLGMN